MSTRVLTVTEVVRHFSEYINRVAYRHEAFILRKANKSVAELRPVSHGRRLGDLPAILRSISQLSRSDATTYALDVEAARSELAASEPRDP